jgi:hypothetical protein
MGLFCRDALAVRQVNQRQLASTGVNWRSIHHIAARSSMNIREHGRALAVRIGVTPLEENRSASAQLHVTPGRLTCKRAPTRPNGALPPHISSALRIACTGRATILPQPRLAKRRPAKFFWRNCFWSPAALRSAAES